MKSNSLKMALSNFNKAKESSLDGLELLNESAISSIKGGRNCTCNNGSTYDTGSCTCNNGSTYRALDF